MLGKVAALTEKFGWLVFLPGKKILPEEVASLPDLIEEDGGRSPAQRLRGVLYRMWEQKGKQGDFETYYRSKMEMVINQVKEKLT